MIALITGTIIEKLPRGLIVDVQGIGYEVLVSERDLDACLIGEGVRLYTYFHVRENSQELFGFMSMAAKQLFEQLLSVNGIGPKGALAIMGLGSDAQIKGAISSNNVPFITSASGVGKKAAEKVILELKDKVGVIAGVILDDMPSSSDEAVEALQALGFTTAQALHALRGVARDASTQDRVKEALKELKK